MQIKLLKRDSKIKVYSDSIVASSA